MKKPSGGMILAIYPFQLFFFLFSFVMHLQCVTKDISKVSSTPFFFLRKYASDFLNFKIKRFRSDMCDRQNPSVMETTQIDVWCIKQEEDEEENKRALQELRRSLDQEEMDTDSRSTEPSEMNVEASKMNVEPNEMNVDSSSIELNEMNAVYNLDSIELPEVKCASFSDLGQREEMDIDSISTLWEPSETPVGCTSKLNEPQGLNTEFVSKSSDSHSKLNEPEALKACPKTGKSRESSPSSDQFKEIETESALTLSCKFKRNQILKTIH